MCKNVLETDTFTCSNGQTTYKIIISLIVTKSAFVFINVHEMFEAVCWTNSRWNNYKDHSSKFDRGDCMQRHL